MSLLKWVPLMILFHAGYSLMRWRKFLVNQNSTERFFIPSDILVEALVAFLAGIVATIFMTSKSYKLIKDTPCSYSYDSSYSQPNLKNITVSRAPAMRKAILSKLDKLSSS